MMPLCFPSLLSLSVTMQIIVLIRINHRSLGGDELPTPYVGNRLRPRPQPELGHPRHPAQIPPTTNVPSPSRRPPLQAPRCPFFLFTPPPPNPSQRYGPFLEQLSFLTFDVVQWFPLNCAYTDGFSAWDALLAVTAIPLVMFVATVVVALLAECAQACKSKKLAGGERESSAKKGGAIISTILGYFMTGILLVLPSISRRICQMMRCTEFDGGDDGTLSLLEMDLEIDCKSPGE